MKAPDLKVFRTGKNLIFLCIVYAFFGCKKEAVNEGYTVFGKVSNIESSSSGVEVKLYNNQVSYTTQPLSSGSYELKNVKAGEYTLAVSQSKVKGNVAQNKKVTVKSTNEVVNLVLPNPVELICTDHPANSIKLNWTKSQDEGFREYKIYQGYNSGLDETTGTLIHVTTSQNDTMFVDNGVNPLGNYYYRVFVMDEYGKIGGSNVLHVLTDDNPYLYVLTEVTNFPANNNLGIICGVTFDGQYVWLAYRLDLGGFYDLDKVTLAKYDMSNYSMVSSFTYQDKYEPLGGLTFDGQNLWLQYSASGTGGNFIREIDATTGAIIKSYSTDYGVWGLSFFNNLLYLNYYYRKIEKISPQSGALISSNNTPSTIDDSYGIAIKNDEIWISIRLSGEILVLNHDFTLKGYVANSFDFSQLCFINNQLIIATMNRVYIYNISSNRSKAKKY